MEAPIYPHHTSSLGYQYQPVASRAIPIINPKDRSESLGEANVEDDVEADDIESNSQRDPETWARIDDDDDTTAQSIATPYDDNGNALPRDTLDPFDDDEFNPFAPPSASDLAVLNGSQNMSYGSHYSLTDGQIQYPPPIFYSTDEDAEADENYAFQQTANMDQDMTPLEMLVIILRDMDPVKIEKAFEKCGYDFERTLDFLIASSHSNQQNVLPIPPGVVRSTQTCRHFLQGNCFRKDCWYSHDLDTMVSNLADLKKAQRAMFERRYMRVQPFY
ncbi:hypothetical protein BCR41DRAFT_355190 [Lobosporangium transversale]|uniref:C3H1-type domain-containing protein n=1 Tax=Lobosporangium transversale TaxID=64571 RepID=A0A1Y2GKU1_9FUNG|nr:hypothetical protein BCR41DRAFT_355190 [Lobosporangium transversale]ORZ13926.1 hypothetical protein BCR41DRAFT_355190 [Lobosporangium transversale]|eukprot:XP_021880710.1 hypothetical protein BCR41DRAFT_355190 [Lobosporangium transversale]